MEISFLLSVREFDCNKNFSRIWELFMMSTWKLKFFTPSPVYMRDNCLSRYSKMLGRHLPDEDMQMPWREINNLEMPWRYFTRPNLLLPDLPTFCYFRSASLTDGIHLRTGRVVFVSFTCSFISIVLRVCGTWTFCTCQDEDTGCHGCCCCL